MGILFNDFLLLTQPQRPVGAITSIFRLDPKAQSQFKMYRSVSQVAAHDRLKQLFDSCHTAYICLFLIMNELNMPTPQLSFLFVTTCFITSYLLVLLSYYYCCNSSCCFLHRIYCARVLPFFCALLLLLCYYVLFSNTQ